MLSTQIHLVSRPQGEVSHDNFESVEVELPALGVDEVRVRNEFISVDPYMRGRMNEGKSYVEPFELNQRSEEHTSELQSRGHLVCRLLLEKKNAHGRSADGSRFRQPGMFGSDKPFADWYENSGEVDNENTRLNGTVA